MWGPWTKLHKAKLHRVKLNRANLHRAKLHKANLQKAKWHRAKWHRAKLHRAKLHRAKLHRAKWPEPSGTERSGTERSGTQPRLGRELCVELRRKQLCKLVQVSKAPGWEIDHRSGVRPSAEIHVKKLRTFSGFLRCAHDPLRSRCGNKKLRIFYHV